MDAQNRDARHAKIFNASIDEIRTKRLTREVRFADSEKETADAKLARVRRLQAKRASSAKDHRVPNIQTLRPLGAMQVWLTEIAVADFSMARLSGNDYGIELLSHNDGCNLQDDRITAGQIIRHGIRKGIFSNKGFKEFRKTLCI